MKKRKSLKKTQRLITIGDGSKADKSRCCKAEIKESGIYPFHLYCDECLKRITFEDQVLWYKEKGKR